MATVLLTSCKDNETHAISEPPVTDNLLASFRWSAFIYPKNSKLKRIYSVDSQYAFVQTLSEYRYDDFGKIEKIIYSASDNSYDEYKYNTNGQLSSISRYISNDLTQITTFTYDDSGKKIKEETENRVEESVFYGLSYTLFKYDNDKLVKTEDYNKGTLRSYKLYEYNDSGELMKEKLFVPDDDSYVTTEHIYAEGLLIYTVTYNEDDKESGFMFDTKRYYDLNDNMTLTIDNMPGLSSLFLPNGKQPTFLERRIYEY